ncbi:unnamed protein product [Brachionus calyciflorus]|uniref:Uncharacterized protein n=1 Tax=Brachionus calyciflorus TaxID=104777 RepID=A0A813N0C2_9BILA|nr:unnamed protein product [Brachionus calyciflorus]
MLIGVLIVLIGVHSVIGEKTLVENNEYPYLMNSQELSKRAFEALGKRDILDNDNFIDELLEKNLILKKMLRHLLRQLEKPNENFEKRGFEALGKRSNDDEKTNVDKQFSLFKRGFESLGRR